MIYRQKLSSGMALFLVSSALSASGFRIPETSIAGLGTANAMVANYKELGSIPYNPATMSFLEGRNLVVGGAHVKTDIHVDPDNGTATDNTGDSSLFIPHYYYMSTLNPTWSYGLNINVPFGLETKWPAGTFSSFAGALVSYAPEASRLEMLNINPNVSYRAGNVSVAFGINYYDIRTLVFNTQKIRIDGSGGDIGWNIAALYVENDLSVGFSYRSPIKVDLDGRLSESIVGTTSDATASTEFPSILQLGARYQLNYDWAVEFDIDRTGWSSFDTVNIKHSDTVLISATGKNTITSTNNWKDTNAYRLGAEYRTDPRGKLRFGYSKDNTAQDDHYFSARIPDADRQLFSLGYLRNLKTWGFEIGYMYAKGDERNINSTTNYLIQAAGGNTDPNGTNAYNGKYRSNVHILGVGFNIKL